MLFLKDKRNSARLSYRLVKSTDLPPEQQTCARRAARVQSSTLGLAHTAVIYGYGGDATPDRHTRELLNSLGQCELGHRGWTDPASESQFRSGRLSCVALHLARIHPSQIVIG